MQTQDSHQEPESAADVLALVFAGDDGAIEQFPITEDIAIELADLVANEQVGDRLISHPRPTIRDGAHPARLLLYALARQFRYTNDAPDLAADYLEALDAALGRGAMVWAGIAASTWCRFLMHQSEAGSGWPAARAVLARHDREDAPPQMLASFAMIAERAGDLAAARELWDLARSHPDLVASARTRWSVEYDWARSHLMLSGGAPARAAIVLRRVHAGLAQLEDAQGRLLFAEATLELAMALVLLGRPSEAIGVFEQTWNQVAGETELTAWMHGCSATSLALLGRTADAQAALDASGRAATDTSTLELAGTIPAVLLLASEAHDVDAFEAAIARARAHEREREADSELSVIWRMFAVLGALGMSSAGRARVLADELASELMIVTPPLPTHSAHGDLLVAIARCDRPAQAQARDRLDALGVADSRHDDDPWGFLARLRAISGRAHLRSQVVPARVRLEVLDGLRVLVNGNEAPVQMWSSRRKPRTALALLVAAGGRIDREVLVEALWGPVSMTEKVAQKRISTVLSVVRNVIGAEKGESVGDSSEAPISRLITFGAVVIELVLADGDSTDIADLRRLARGVVAADSADVCTLEGLAEQMVALTRGQPLRGLGLDPQIVEWQMRLRDEAVEAVLKLNGSWIAATEQSRVAPPPAIVALAENAVRLDPLDETAAIQQFELFARAGRIVDASRAFHRLRETLDRELGLKPSIHLVRRHAAVVESISE